MTKRIIAGLAMMAGLAVPSTVSAEAAEAFFKTPGGAVYCVAEGSMYCWTPNDGFTVQMGIHSRATKRYYRSNKRYPSGYPTLRFGQSRTFYGGIRCDSRHDGLTCVNRAGHGWWLGRWVGYRIF
jgi:hypothetical protein